MELDKSIVARKKVCFGLFSHLVYVPTNSRVHSFERYYSPLLAEELKDLFALSDEALAKHLAKCNCYEQAVNGNLLVEGLVSADKQFVSMRLSQFAQIDYKPVCEERYLQGEVAQRAALVFGL